MSETKPRTKADPKEFSTQDVLDVIKYNQMIKSAMQGTQRVKEFCYHHRLLEDSLEKQMNTFILNNPGIKICGIQYCISPNPCESARIYDRYALMVYEGGGME